MLLIIYNIDNINKNSKIIKQYFCYISIYLIMQNQKKKKEISISNMKTPNANKWQYLTYNQTGIFNPNLVK